jgi:hypothetical protein
MEENEMTLTKTGTMAIFAVTVALSVGTAIAADRTPIPTPSAPKMTTFTELRDVQYCEVWLFTGSVEKGIWGTYYNTSDLNNSADKMNTCPAAVWDKVTVDGLKATWDVIGAYKNGPRGWTYDSVEIPVGPVETFEGIEARWWGAGELPKGVDLKVAHMTPYEELKSHRQSSFTFEAGKPLFILDDPDGTPWVMQAFSKILDPNLTYADLSDLAAKLKPPAGWKFRVTTLDKDLIISTPEGYNWIVQDELQNTYDACKGGACNVKP